MNMLCFAVYTHTHLSPHVTPHIHTIFRNVFGGASVLFAHPRADIDREDVVHLLELCFGSCSPVGI